MLSNEIITRGRRLRSPARVLPPGTHPPRDGARDAHVHYRLVQPSQLRMCKVDQGVRLRGVDGGSEFVMEDELLVSPSKIQVISRVLQ